MSNLENGLIIGISSAIPAYIRNRYENQPVPEELVRRAGVRMIYETTDITEDIAPWLLSVEFTDNLEEADDLQIYLWDDGRWRNSWSPSRGAKLTAEIHLIEAGQTVKLPCGIFAIDEVEIAGPPNTASVRATSAFVTTSLRKEKKTRAWEKIGLRGIAQTIASKAGLTLMFSARNDPQYSRKDQKSRSDLDFLLALCQNEGLRMKVSGQKLVIYSQSEFDTQAMIDTFSPNDGRVIGYRFTTGITSTYNKVVLRYRDAKQKKMIEHVYVPPDPPATGQTLRINERCETKAEAERIAPNRLASANRGAKDASLDIIGDVRMLVGQNIGARGFGSEFDGLYAIEGARHSVWPYSTGLTLRKI